MPNRKKLWYCNASDNGFLSCQKHISFLMKFLRFFTCLQAYVRINHTEALKIQSLKTAKNCIFQYVYNYNTFEYNQYIGILKNTFQYFRILQIVSEYFRIFQNTSEYFRMLCNTFNRVSSRYLVICKSLFILK